MKRVSGLWNKLCSVETAITAIYRGTENKRSDHEVVRRYGYKGDKELQGKLCPEKVEIGAKKLVAIYQNGWEPAPLRAKHLCEPRQKERELGIPSLTDHLLGWMLILTISNVILRGMHPYCCGSVPGRGIEYARKAVERWVQHDTQSKYYVQLDIRHYYENIDNERLKAKFRRIIKDERVLAVVDKHIDAGLNVIDQDGNKETNRTGQPVGTYPAPWFSNFYLQDLDHYATQCLYKERRGKRTNYVRHYLRYVDNILLVGSSKRDLGKAVRAVIAYCDEMGLEIKPCWMINEIGELMESGNGSFALRPGTSPINIVGYKYYREQTTVRGNIYLHTTHIANKISKDLNSKGYVIVHDAQALLSLLGWFTHADSINFFKNTIEPKVNVKLMKEVISYADKNGIGGTSARVYCDQRERDGKYHLLYGCA